MNLCVYAWKVSMDIICLSMCMLLYSIRPDMTVVMVVLLQDCARVPKCYQTNRDKQRVRVQDILYVDKHRNYTKH